MGSAYYVNKIMVHMLQERCLRLAGETWTACSAFVSRNVLDWLQNCALAKTSLAAEKDGPSAGTPSDHTWWRQAFQGGQAINVLGRSCT